MLKSVALWAITLVWQVLTATSGLAQAIQTIALTGDPFPGAEDGTTLDRFGVPAFNNHGQVAFVSSFSRDGQGGGQGIIFGDSNGLRAVARSGEQAPGTPDGTPFSSFEPLFWDTFTSSYQQLNDEGTVAFLGSLCYNCVFDTKYIGLWMWNASDGSTQLRVRGGEPVPSGTDGEIFVGNGPIANINSAGDVSFYGASRVPPDGANSGIWRTESGIPRKVAVRSSLDDIPGYPEYYFDRDFDDRIHLDDLGRMNFTASYQSPAGPASGIWRVENGRYELLVHSGQPAMGEAGDVTFAAQNSSPSAVFNDIGQSVVEFNLAGTEVTDADDYGIWLFNGSQLEKIVRAGDAVPGLPGNLVFGQIRPYDLGNSGGAVFTAQLLTSSSESVGRSIWKYSAGNLELVARTGAFAPGTESGTTFGEVSIPEINARNQAAFWGRLESDEIGNSYVDGLWAQDLSGNAQLIVRRGDQIEVRPGDVRTISKVSIGSSFIPYVREASYLNDQGQIVFVANFTDGSQGMFISNLVAVPEPTALALALIGLPVACKPRRMRRS